MPAVLKSTDGSFSGTSGADGMIACHLLRKKSRYFWRISETRIGDIEKVIKIVD
jgi:hypothetical protein